MQKIVVLHVMSKTLVILGCATLVFSSLAGEVQTNWVPCSTARTSPVGLFAARQLGQCSEAFWWELMGMGHIYTDAMCSDFEAKGFGQINS